MTETTATLRNLGTLDYQTCWHAMKNFTDSRHERTTDEIWIVEHPPVFTQGQNGKPEHVIQPSNIPIVPTDRGGQITYHGPGQLVVYTLIDVKRKKWNVRQLVSALENTVIDYLKLHELKAVAKCSAPGVYIADKKICSVGLRIRKGCSYHGLAFNLDMDLKPFSWINPCGFAGLQMTQLKNELGSMPTKQEIVQEFSDCLANNLGYTTLHLTDQLG